MAPTWAGPGLLFVTNFDLILFALMLFVNPPFSQGMVKPKVEVKMEPSGGDLQMTSSGLSSTNSGGGGPNNLQPQGGQFPTSLENLLGKGRNTPQPSHIQMQIEPTSSSQTIMVKNFSDHVFIAQKRQPTPRPGTPCCESPPTRKLILFLNKNIPLIRECKNFDVCLCNCFDTSGKTSTLIFLMLLSKIAEIHAWNNRLKSYKKAPISTQIFSMMKSIEQFSNDSQCNG